MPDMEARPRRQLADLRSPRESEPPARWWWPGWCSLRGAVTSLIALSVVFFTGAVLYAPLTSGTTEGIQIAQGIMALLGPILGSVLGYYFGAASGERVAEQASQSAEQAVEQKAEIRQVSDEALASAYEELR